MSEFHCGPWIWQVATYSAVLTAVNLVHSKLSTVQPASDIPTDTAVDNVDVPAESKVVSEMTVHVCECRRWHC